MLTYLLYTCFFILGYACFLKMLHFSIQPGQWIDKVWNWQDKLRVWDENGSPWAKWLGGCEMCFSAFFSLLAMPVYLAFLHPWGLFGWWSLLVIWLAWGIQTIVAIRLILWK